MQGIESLTSAVVSTALDAASIRQQVIAANIANAGRSDYGARGVSFEAALSRLSPHAMPGSSAPSQPSIDLSARLVSQRDGDGGAVPVQFDVEMGALARNGVHYQALIKGLNKYLSVMASAVSDGKR